MIHFSKHQQKKPSEKREMQTLREQMKPTENIGVLQY